MTVTDFLNKNVFIKCFYFIQNSRIKGRSVFVYPSFSTCTPKALKKLSWSQLSVEYIYQDKGTQAL